MAGGLAAGSAKANVSCPFGSVVVVVVVVVLLLLLLLLCSSKRSMPLLTAPTGPSDLISEVVWLL